MKKAILIALLTLLATQAQAQSYNWKNGNSYSKSGNGSYRGNNYNTGKTWSGRGQSGGNLSGIDSKGNSWNYNRTTGSYFNSSGEIRTGKGAFRQKY